MSRGLFELLGVLSGFFRQRLAWLAAPIHKLVERWAPHKTREDLGWNEEAELALVEQVPLRAKKLLNWIGFLLLVFLGWAYFTKIDEVTRGEGRVTPSGQVQVIQSLDGGIVNKILVREGQTVLIGDPLVLIDETRATSSFRENRSQYLSLVARQARLRALAEGTAFEPPREVLQEAPVIHAQEYALYLARKEELASQVSIARQQLAQRQKELSEVQAKFQQAERGFDLSSRELSLTRPLESSGAVSEVDLIRLEREASQLRGERDQARAQIGRIQSSILEAQSKIGEIEQNFRSEVRKELSENTAELNSIRESSVALMDRVNQATLRSPVNGTVSRLFYNTVGGVIQPGKEVLEIVPSDDSLVLETKIEPKDIAFVRILQPATVKLTAYDYTIYGTLDGIVENVSADSVIDDEGNAFYIVKVRTLRSNFGKELPIIPGMMAQVDIVTGKKSVLTYLLKPVIKAKSQAFTER